MNKKEYFNIIKSNVPGFKEVVVTFTDKKGNEKHDFIFVKEKENANNQYYIDEANKKFKLNTARAKKVKRKKKPLLIALASLGLVGAIATGVTLGVLLPNHNIVNPQKDAFNKMREYYIDYIIDTSIGTENYEFYKDLSADQIMKHVYWKRDADRQPVFTTLKVKRIAGIDTLYMDQVNYNDGSERDAWTPGNHVSQAKLIAVVATVRNDPKIMDIAVRMTYYWVYNHYRSTNWWHNELGAGANYLADLGLFVYDYLNDQGKTLLTSKVANASIYYRPSLTTSTGTNLIDYADITLRSSILSKNTDEFNVATSRIEQELNTQHSEGFQQDGSFFQHGKHVQTTSYGKEGIIRLAKVLRAISATGHVFPEEKMEILEKFILRGLRDMTHRGYINYSSGSRAYVRRDNLNALGNNSLNFNNLKEYVALPDFKRNEELQEYLDNLNAHEPTFYGVDYFNDAHMIAANIKNEDDPIDEGIYISFKGTDSDLTNTECVNEENRLGLNMSYGTNTCIMNTGLEYYNVSAFWNYAYIPGTTSINVNDDIEPRKPEDIPVHQYEDFDHPEYNDFVLNLVKGDKYYKDELFETFLPESGVYGGGTNVNNDFNDFDIEEEITWSMQKSVHHNENSFAVSCLATKYGFVFIGGDLSYDGSVTGGLFNPRSERRLHTTLQQRMGPQNSENALSNDEKTFTDEDGKIVYKILDDTNTITTKTANIIKLKNAWGRNRNPSADEKEEEISGTTTLAYIDHGPAFDSQTGEPIKYKYAYSIQTGSLAARDDISFEVVHNCDTNEGTNPGWEVQEVLIRKKISDTKEQVTDVIFPLNDGPTVGEEETATYLPYICTDAADRVPLTKGEVYATDTVVQI